jgi:hypothetical protein
LGAPSKHTARPRRRYPAQDPSIREIAQQISLDPAFRQMAGSLAQASGSPDAPATPAVDPAAYMQAMQGMMSNPEFMHMAERLGTQMMQARQRCKRTRATAAPFCLLHAHALTRTQSAHPGPRGVRHAEPDEQPGVHEHDAEQDERAQGRP